MYTPVNDYMRPLKKDFDNLIIYLEKYYNKNNSDQVRQSLRGIHKHIWMSIIWKKELIKQEDVFVNDIILNLLAIIHNCVIGDLKVINFLTRNIIEDYIKHCKNYYAAIDVNSAPRDIFPIIFAEATGDTYIHSNFEIIKSTYTQLCTVVHSTNLDSAQVCCCLEAYDKFYTDEHINREVIKLDNVYRAINNINCAMNINAFKVMNIDSQCILRDYIRQDDLQELMQRM